MNQETSGAEPLNKASFVHTLVWHTEEIFAMMDSARLWAWQIWYRSRSDAFTRGHLSKKAEIATQNHTVCNSVDCKSLQVTCKWLMAVDARKLGFKYLWCPCFFVDFSRCIWSINAAPGLRDVYISRLALGWDKSQGTFHPTERPPTHRPPRIKLFKNHSSNAIVVRSNQATASALTIWAHVDGITSKFGMPFSKYRLITGTQVVPD